jgi:hypothetical protein
MFWNRTWTELRHEPPRADRKWMRWAELLERCRAAGLVVSDWDVRKAVRAVGLPPKVYGHYRFEERHWMAVRSYADREGLTAKGAV